MASKKKKPKPVRPEYWPKRVYVVVYLGCYLRMDSTPPDKLWVGESLIECRLVPVTKRKTK